MVQGGHGQQNLYMPIIIEVHAQSTLHLICFHVTHYFLDSGSIVHFRMVSLQTCPEVNLMIMVNRNNINTAGDAFCNVQLYSHLVHSCSEEMQCSICGS